MEGLLEIIKVVLTSVTSVIVALIAGGYFRKYQDKQKDKRSRSRLVEQIQKDELVHFSLREMRRKYNCDRLYIMQYHNGGNFYTESPMQKASITYERCSDGLERIADKYQNVLISNFAWYHNNLLKDDCYFIDVNLIDDITMRSWIKSFGTHAHIGIPVYDNQKHLVANIGLDWVFSDIPEIYLENNQFSQTIVSELKRDIESIKQYI
jgi:hypothetical protein